MVITPAFCGCADVWSSIWTPAGFSRLAGYFACLGGPLGTLLYRVLVVFFFFFFFFYQLGEYWLSSSLAMRDRSDYYLYRLLTGDIA